MSLLSILQLASPQLPIGAYGYSEGIEFLVEQGVIYDSFSLDRWLRRELAYGSIRIDGGILVRVYQGLAIADYSTIVFWNNWLSAQRESEELRIQSWVMGNALVKLFNDISDAPKIDLLNLDGDNYNYAVAFGMVAFYWEIALGDAILSFLFAWVSNLVSAGIRSIPIGQTAGQKILLNLHSELKNSVPAILSLQDEDLASCNIGLALASMGHESQYSRLFRS
jgi:urease accessory protein